MFSSVWALPSLTVVEDRSSFITDESILAPSPSHSQGRNESGDCNRQEHGSGAVRSHMLAILRKIVRRRSSRVGVP